MPSPPTQSSAPFHVKAMTMPNVDNSQPPIDPCPAATKEITRHHRRQHHRRLSTSTTHLPGCSAPEPAHHYADRQAAGCGKEGDACEPERLRFRGRQLIACSWRQFGESVLVKIAAASAMSSRTSGMRGVSLTPLEATDTRSACGWLENALRRRPCR
jgi:hypothetical protein